MTQIDLSNQQANKTRIGAILRAFRDGAEISQKDIAESLNYANVNFISMMETGRSSPPIGRVSEIVSVYECDSIMTLVILKYLYPEAWSAILSALNDCHDIFGIQFSMDARNKIDQRVEKKFTEYIKTFSLAA